MDQSEIKDLEIMEKINTKSIKYILQVCLWPQTHPRKIHSPNLTLFKIAKSSKTRILPRSIIFVVLFNLAYNGYFTVGLAWPIF